MDTSPGLLIISICDLEYGQPHVSRGGFKPRILLLEKPQMKMFRRLAQRIPQKHQCEGIQLCARCRKRSSMQESLYGLVSDSMICKGKKGSDLIRNFFHLLYFNAIQYVHFLRFKTLLIFVTFHFKCWHKPRACLASLG